MKAWLEQFAIPHCTFRTERRWYKLTANKCVSNGALHVLKAGPQPMKGAAAPTPPSGTPSPSTCGFGSGQRAASPPTSQQRRQTRICGASLLPTSPWATMFVTPTTSKTCAWSLDPSTGSFAFKVFPSLPATVGFSVRLFVCILSMRCSTSPSAETWRGPPS